MGIPLLHPWANRLGGFEYDVAGTHVDLPRSGMLPVDEHGLPIHGVLPGLLHWEVVHAAGPDLRAGLEWSSSTLLELFPFPHRLELEVTVETGRLMFATTLRPVGPRGVPVSFGYHPYLRIPGTARETWRVSLGVSRRIVLDERMLPTGERDGVREAVTSLGETSLDHAFEALAAPARFEAVGGGTRLAVELIDGFPYAQVYAPFRREFICFEPMTAPTNALSHGDGLRIVQPGDSHRAVFMISLHRDN
jgi:galactose mutarotase-like enzyme